MASRAHRYPSLLEYLKHAPENPTRRRVEIATAFGIIGTFFLGPALGIAVGTLLMSTGLIWSLSVLIGLAAMIGGFIGGSSIVAKWVRPLSKPKNRDEEIIIMAIERINSLEKLVDENKFQRWMDPVAGQLLEAGAFHYSRINQSLNAPAWKTADLPDHWKTLRARTQLSSERAMSELIILLGGCVGEPTRSKEDDIKDLFCNFAGLNIVDALHGLGQVISTSSDDYVFHSSEAQIAFEPGRQIAERLKTLADEVEEASRVAHAETIDVSVLGSSIESMDQLLGDFRAVRNAEAELDRETEIHERF